jgi:hypothetical protein
VTSTTPAATSTPYENAKWWITGGHQKPGPYRGWIVPLGTTRTLTAQIQLGKPQMVVVTVSKVFEPGPPSGYSHVSSSATTLPSATWKWVGVQISLANNGPLPVGNRGGPGQPMLYLNVNGWPYSDFTQLAGMTSIGGCPAITYPFMAISTDPILASGGRTEGCLAFQVPIGVTVRSVGLEMYSAGAGCCGYGRAALATWNR